MVVYFLGDLGPELYIVVYRRVNGVWNAYRFIDWYLFKNYKVQKAVTMSMRSHLEGNLKLPLLYLKLGRAQ